MPKDNQSGLISIKGEKSAAGGSYATLIKDKRDGDREDLFAAMPPLEAKRMLFRMFAVESNRQGKVRQKLMFIDVK